MGESFDHLYQATMDREHPLLWEVQRLAEDGVCDDMLATVRLAKLLQQAGIDYAETVHDLAIRNRMRIRPMPPCPGCGYPDCPGALFVYNQPVSAGLSSFVSSLFGK